jgi:pimeloyl-ACP methyl ester carboxylesterase
VRSTPRHKPFGEASLTSKSQGAIYKDTRLMTNFSPDFWDVFVSTRVKVGDVHLHVVTGGVGPPVMLLAGWPQTWYAWRNVMCKLALTRTLIVAEPRGFGASDKPLGPYDLTTVARDLIDLMDLLGYQSTFDLVGHDVGAWISYAMAADYRTRISRLALVDAAIPGVSPSPSALAPKPINNRVWHFGFNRLGPELNEALVRGREHAFFSWQFRNKAGRPDALSEGDIATYVEAYSDPETLRAGFDYYRAIEVNLAQNALRIQTKLEIPVFLIAGERGVGQSMLTGISEIARNVSGHLLPEVGHYIPDEAPSELADLLQSFLDR